MFGDVLGMVAVGVDILYMGARFAVRAVDLVGEVKGHVEEVGDLSVGNSSDPKAMFLEHQHHLLLDLLHLGWGEAAHGEDVVPICADVDRKVLQLGQQEQGYQITSLGPVIRSHCNVEIDRALFHPGAPVVDTQGLFGVEVELAVLFRDVDKGGGPVQGERG